MYRFVLILMITLIVNVSFSQKSVDISIDGGSLSVQILGKQKDTLILINGGPGMNSSGFESLAETISKWATVILYDQRGTGSSEIERLDTSSMNMDLMVEDLEAIRQYLGLKKWIVMGHSFGGMLVALYIKNHAEHAEKVILSSSGGLDLSLLTGFSVFDHMTETQVDSFRYWNAEIEAGDTTYHALFNRAKCLAPAYLHYADKDRVNEIARRLTQVNRDINRMLWADMRTRNFDCKEAASKFDAPVLILQGQDDILSTDIALQADSLFPKSNLVLMKDCAHYGWLDQPKIYFEAIKKFIKK